MNAFSRSDSEPQKQHLGKVPTCHVRICFAVTWSVTLRFDGSREVARKKEYFLHTHVLCTTQQWPGLQWFGVKFMKIAFRRQKTALVARILHLRRIAEQWDMDTVHCTVYSTLYGGKAEGVVSPESDLFGGCRKIISRTPSMGNLVFVDQSIVARSGSDPTATSGYIRRPAVRGPQSYYLHFLRSTVELQGDLG
jgi:hypothetical protein